MVTNGGSFNVGVGVGGGSSFRCLGYSKAVSDAPAAAEVTAMMARVDLDMCEGARIQQGCEEGFIERKTRSGFW